MQNHLEHTCFFQQKLQIAGLQSKMVLHQHVFFLLQFLPLSEDTLKVAFDGDSVIFSEDSQSIYDKHGIKAFERNEKNLAKFPLSGGPFKSFLFELHKLQKKFTPSNCPIKIALVTARSAPSHERVIRTLRDWGIRIDECLFLGGLDKGSFLRVFDADIFFDDQIENCSSASTFVPTAHVISMSH